MGDHLFLNYIFLGKFLLINRGGIINPHDVTLQLNIQIYIYMYYNNKHTHLMIITITITILIIIKKTIKKKNKKSIKK